MSTVKFVVDLSFCLLERYFGHVILFGFQNTIVRPWPAQMSLKLAEICLLWDNIKTHYTIDF